MYDVSNSLVNSFDNYISLQIAGSDRFLLQSIIIQHLLKLMSNEFRTSVISDLSWPRVSGKPFLFGDVSDGDCSFVIILMDLEPTGGRIDHGDKFADEVLLAFSANCVWSDEVNAHFIPRYCFGFLFR